MGLPVLPKSHGNPLQGHNHNKQTNNRFTHLRTTLPSTPLKSATIFGRGKGWGGSLCKANCVRECTFKGKLKDKRGIGLSTPSCFCPSYPVRVREVHIHTYTHTHMQTVRCHFGSNSAAAAAAGVFCLLHTAARTYTHTHAHWAFVVTAGLTTAAAPHNQEAPPK